MTACFTGHRPSALCGYNRSRYVNFIYALRNELAKLPIDRFISGGAQGFDQLAFWSVYELAKYKPGVKNILVLPFETFGQQWPAQGCFSQADLALCKQSATEIHILPNQAGVRALFQRNHAMVDMSDMVIALYENDAWPYAKGGTAECMRYAASHSKQLLQIRYETESGQLTLKGLERIR